MRYVVAGAALLMTLWVDAGTSAHAAKWCARYNDGSTNCGFFTIRQCRASISGVGGGCYRNVHWRRR